MFSGAEGSARQRGGRTPLTVAAGERIYAIGNAPCSGVGLKWSGDELGAAIDGSVAAVLFDDAGKADIEEILADLADTNFAQEGLRRILADPVHMENWRVGEAIAKSYLTDHQSCCFPWPDRRDERKSGSSLPGADLVGFGIDDKGDCFAFGEVKMSSENKYPPGAMYGRTGLKQQLEDLRDKEVIRDDLFKYLGHRAKEAPWRPRFEKAGGRYLQNKSDIRLYGFLVRDVEPCQDDLKARVTVLARNCPAGTQITLLALYLPEHSIGNIGEVITARRAKEGKP